MPEPKILAELDAQIAAARADIAFMARIKDRHERERALYDRLR